MKKLSFLLVFAFPFFLSAQTIFWTENFNNGCQSDCDGASYVGTVGPWTQTILSAEGDEPNAWYVSCAENGHTNNVCGTGCMSAAPTATLASLHISSSQNTYGDLGAAYDAGGWCGFLWCVETDRRIESPSINCSGRTNITVNFNYIETGGAPLDDASVWYNSGTGWTLLVNTPATNNTGCGGQGNWTSYSFALPPACNNNANVKIGFRWVNNDDGVGTDPSFAVDDITLTVPGGVSPPVSAFTPSASTVCVGQAVTFTDNSTNSPTGWQWTFIGGNPMISSVQNPTITWASPGTYTVTLVASNSGGNGNTASQTITVVASPSVSANANPNPLCSGSPVTLSATGASSYSWMPGGMTGSPITQSPTSTITYTVTGTTGSCTGTATVTVSVIQAPTASFSGLANSYCSTASAVTMTGSPIGGTFSGPGVTGSSFSPSGAGVGTHTIVYTVSGSGGCNGTTSQTVTVSNPPTASFTGLNSSYCINSTNATMIGTPSGGVFTGPGVSGSTFSPSVAGLGTHTVTYTFGTVGCQGTSTQNASVFALPIVNLTLDVDSLCTTAAPVTLGGGSPTPGTYSGTGVSSNMFSPAATGPSPGTYMINYSFTDANNCTAMAQDQIVLYVCTPLSIEFGSHGIITVYPNPGNGNFKIESNVSGGCKIVDMKGAVLKTFEMKSGTNSFDISAHPAGIYFLQIETSQGNKVVTLEKI